MKVKFYILYLLIVFLLLGCGKPEITTLVRESKVLAFGDSLTRGFGVSEEYSYPSVLEELLGCEVINSGVSGEDTKSGLERLPEELEKYRPDLVILCFGGNDMLRKQSSVRTKSNLQKMIRLVKESGSDIVLVGVPKPGLILRVPEFYEELSDEFDLPYEGDVLKEVLSNGGLKSDHIHPNEKGYKMIADRILTLIKASEA